MNIAIKFFLVSFLFAIVTGITGQDVSFFKEDITFKIEGEYFYVNGIYYLSCSQNSDSSIALFYPFPTDSIHSKPDSLYIFNLNTGEEITDYLQHDHGLLFHIGLDSVTAILVSYRQQFKFREMRYILTTTQYWGKPLEEATFKLILNSNIRIRSFSYQPDSCGIFGETIVYYWEKKNFMPLEDMIFTLD
ncbi:MAG: hypothetical protein JXB24_06610 [Bacteroidales bacterium]|nr:hypothetical protein [Bacteroidales bacterium]